MTVLVSGKERSDVMSVFLMVVAVAVVMIGVQRADFRNLPVGFGEIFG